MFSLSLPPGLVNLDKDATSHSSLEQLATNKMHLDQEYSILVLKLEILKYFMNAAGVETPTFTQADRCRTLQNECEIIEGLLLKKGLAELALARLESRFQSLGHPMCSDWAKDQGLSGDRILQMEATEPAVELAAGTSLKCCEPDCIHYIYGFSSIQSLQDHLLQQHAQQPYAIQHLVDHPQPVSKPTISLDSSSTHLGTNTEEDLRCIQFDPTPSKKRKQAMPLPRSKRARATEEEKVNMKLVKTVGSCLRCRVLKKRCDDEGPCHHCPKQDSSAGADFWKSIGCQRRISDLAEIFLPAHLMTDNRLFRNRKGTLVCLHLQKSTDNLLYHRQFKCLAYIIKKNSRFRQLDDFCWEMKSPMSLLMTQVGLVEDKNIFKVDHEENDVDGDDDGEKDGYNLEAYHKPAWDLLRVTGLGGDQYFCETAYNPFTLVRLGNVMHKHKWNKIWSCVAMASLLLDSITTIYENEHMLRALLADNDPESDVEVEKMTSILEGVLSSLLPEINCLLSRRTRLAADHWIGVFFTLCYFSVAKSILIDIWDFRAGYEEQCPWRPSDTIRICGAYKALVSIFNWSSPCDYLLLDWDAEVGNTSGVDPKVKDMFQQIQRMVHKEKWEERGIGSSKEFLMGLGSGFFKDGTFNGFFIQKYKFD